MELLQCEECIKDGIISSNLISGHLIDILALLHNVGVITILGDQLQLVIVVIVLKVVTNGVVFVDAGVSVECDEVSTFKFLLFLRVPFSHDFQGARIIFSKISFVGCTSNKVADFLQTHDWGAWAVWVINLVCIEHLREDESSTIIQVWFFLILI